MRSNTKAGGRKLPKTWASTHGVYSRGGTSSTTKTSARGRPKLNSFTWKKSAAQVEREAKQQELERGLEVYTHKSPAGPPFLPGSSFLNPVCKPSTSSHTLDQPLLSHGSTARDRATRLKMPALAYTADYEEASDLLSCLGAGPMGLDLEWNFSRAGASRTALLQICSPSLILVIHLSAMSHRIPPLLKSILEDPSIVKTGVAIKNDALKLQRDYAIDTRNVVELSNMVKLAQPKVWQEVSRLISLRDLTRIYLGRKLRKDGVRVSDWERCPLDAEQLEYAASDTFASLEVLRASAEYFKPTGQRVGGGKGLLDELDEMVQERADPAMDLETALRLSAYDLYEERVGTGSTERQKRDQMLTALREVQSNAQPLPPSSPPSPTKSKPQQPTKPSSRSKSSDKENNQTDSDDDFVTVTGVLRAHERALNRWLYSHRTIAQVAESSNIKLSTAAFYILKALFEAIKATGKQSVLSDFTPADRARLENELNQLGRKTYAIHGHYRKLAEVMGWKKEGSSSGCEDEGERGLISTSGSAEKMAPVEQAKGKGGLQKTRSTGTKVGTEKCSREPIVIEVSDDEVDVQDTSG